MFRTSPKIRPVTPLFFVIVTSIIQSVASGYVLRFTAQEQAQARAISSDWSEHHCLKTKLRLCKWRSNVALSPCFGPMSSTLVLPLSFLSPTRRSLTCFHSPRIAVTQSVELSQLNVGWRYHSRQRHPWKVVQQDCHCQDLSPKMRPRHQLKHIEPWN